MSNLIINPYRFGGFVSEIHQPASTTALLRVGFNTDATSTNFDTNTITGVVAGTLTHSSTGGIGSTGGATGWVAGTNNIGHTAQVINGGTSASQYTFICAFKTTESGAAPSIYFTKVKLFGDPSGSVYSELGVSGGLLHVAGSTATPQGTISVDDGAWHMVAFQQTSSTDFVLWVDGVKDTTGSHSGNANSKVSEVGSGYIVTGGGVSPTVMDAIQIYKPTLNDADLGAIFTQAGY
jgi:hypothetical protein